MPCPAPFARRRTAALLAAAMAAVWLAVPGPAVAQTPGQAPEVSSDYRLGPRDRVRVEVFEVPELNAEARTARAKAAAKWRDSARCRSCPGVGVDRAGPRRSPG